MSRRGHLWTGVVVISLASGQGRAESAPPNIPSNAFDANGKFQLANLDVQTLQALHDAMNPTCLPGGVVSCSWTVLSLTHKRVGDEPNFPDTPLISPLQRPRPSKPQRFSNDVPPGFEQFANQESEDIALFYEGESVLTARIVIEGDQFSFSDPLLVANELTRLKIADRADLEYFFSDTFPVSEEGICVSDFQPQDCLTRRPIKLALLPALEKKRVDVMVSRAVKDDTTDAFLPASNTGITARAGVRTTYAAIGTLESTVDGQLDASVSYGDGGIFLKHSFSNQNDSNRINQLFFAHQFKQHQITVGSFDFESTQFLLNNEIIGVDLSTSFNRFTNIRELYSTPLYVTLSSTSVVQLLVNGTLLSSLSLAPGNHRLDTRNLPIGTYEVEVRIQDAADGIRTENQFFSKQLSLPPPDKLVFSLSAGRARARDSNLFETIDSNLLVASAAKRLSPTIGVNVELASFSNAQTAQARLSRIGTQYELSAGALVGSESAIGASLRASYVVKDFQVTFQGTKFSSDHDVQNDDDIARFVREDFLSRSVAAGYSLNDYRFSLSAEKVSEYSNAGKTDRDRYSARMRRRFPLGTADSSISAAYLETDESKEFQFQFDIAFDGPDRRHKTTLELIKSEGAAIQPALGYQFTYNPKKNATPDGTANASLAFRSRVSERSSFAGVDLGQSHQFYDLGIGIDLFDEPSSDGLEARTIASFGTQVAASKDGIAVGRYTGQTAGIIIDVDGQPNGSTFDVMVDGAKRGVGRVGSKFFLPLQPYRQHRVDLLPHSIVLGNFESSSRLVTLYPGNVAALQVDVQGRYVLIARIVDSVGKIISDKIIRYQGQSYFIDGDGVVQIEVVAGEQLDIDLGDDTSCRVDTPKPDGREIVIESVPLVCL